MEAANDLIDDAERVLTEYGYDVDLESDASIDLFARAENHQLWINTSVNEQEETVRLQVVIGSGQEWDYIAQLVANEDELRQQLPDATRIRCSTQNNHTRHPLDQFIEQGGFTAFHNEAEEKDKPTGYHTIDFTLQDTPPTDLPDNLLTPLCDTLNN